MQGMYEDFTAGQFLRYIGALKGMKHRKCKQEIRELLTLVYEDTCSQIIPKSIKQHFTNHSVGTKIFLEPDRDAYRLIIGNG